MSNQFVWNWISKTGSSPCIKKYSKVHETQEHPLKPSSVKIKESGRPKAANRNKTSIEISANSSTGFSDPLGLIASGGDPMNLVLNKKSTSQVTDSDNEDENWTLSSPKLKDKNQLKPWSARKGAILGKFTVPEIARSIDSVSLQEGSTRNKIEDDLNEFEESASFSTQVYCKRLQLLHEEVTESWNQDQKVKTLKIVIQCAKFLNTCYVPSFYPIKFVYVTDILDTFGELVFNRLKSKCATTGQSAGCSARPEDANFSLEMVPDTAKETCRNWFYKVASIRELIPRLYVEAALLRSYTFITSGEQGKNVLRLTKMIRGIGNPLVAIYARCYLCRVALSLSVKSFPFFKENLYEFLLCYDYIFNRNVHLSKKFELSRYLEAFAPALEYIMEGVVHGTSGNVHDEIVTICKRKPNNSLLLSAILTSFKTDNVRNHASEFLRWISEVNNDGIYLYRLMEQFGDHFQVDGCDTSSISAELLKDAWKLISTIENADHYITCIEHWMPISVSLLPIDTVNILLGELVGHLNYDLLYEVYYVRLQNILNTILEYAADFFQLFVLDNFMSYIDLFHAENAKVPVCKMVLEHFVKRMPENAIEANATLVNNFMRISKVLHDSINALTVSDEKRQIGNLICNALMKFSFGRNFEKQLSFYVDARGTFFNFDTAHAALVQCVNRMSLEVLELVGGHHNSRTSSFVRACSAYCYITIPSIASDVTRLQLYLLSAQVSLANQCYGQAEACFEAIIDLMAEFPKSIEIEGKQRSAEALFSSYVCQLLSLLLVVPDSPMREPLHLVRELLNMLQKQHWEDELQKAELYVQTLHMLSVAVSDSYPYHFRYVEANDTLYSSDAAFVAETNRTCSVILDQILKQLQSLESRTEHKKQATLALNLFDCILMRADMKEKSMAKLALNLWNLANKNNMIPDHLRARTIQYYKSKRKYLKEEDQILIKLISALE